MRTHLKWLVAIALPVLLAGAADAQVAGKDITFKSGDETIKGFLATPEGKGPFPAVIVIQEWWGLNDWIKDNSKEFAKKGFVAFAPDLYRGQVTDDMKVASQLRKGLPNDRAMRDLKAAVDTVAANPSVDKSKIGCIGWCMGGQYSLQTALADPRVSACAICYGAVTSDEAKLKTLNARVLGVFGEADAGIPAAGVREFETSLKKLKKDVERINIYPKAGHGFMRPTNGPNPNPVYSMADADDAWRQIFAFFSKSLKK
jgi:carboxymethylenebutenolidase